MLLTLAIVFFALLFLNVPLYIVFFLSSLIILVGYMPNIPLLVVAQTAFHTVTKYSLVAIPFFIFTAMLMSKGGLARRLINFVIALVGNVKGSLGMATIVSAEFFGSLSGSSAATVASLGKILHPLMVKGGYSERFSQALIAAGGATAVLIPPSITMIIYASLANVSVAELFMAGILPGVLLGVGYAVYTLYYVIKNKVQPSEKFSWKRLLSATKDASWAMGVPIVIIGGIYAGIVTPTEAAVVAAAYAIFVELFIYKEIKWKDMYNVTIESVKLTAQINAIIAGAGIFSWVFTRARVPHEMTAFLADAGVSPVVFLLAINIILVFAGMFAASSSLIVIFTPLFVPLGIAMDIDLVHLGIIIIFNLAIGLYTPPFGLNLIVVSGLFNVPISRLVPPMVPFIILSVIMLLLVTYIPQISLFLPSIMLD